MEKQRKVYISSFLGGDCSPIIKRRFAVDDADTLCHVVTARNIYRRNVLLHEDIYRR